jgi:murein DD-endopeptidase MepM/ murein hydrolase activator NlpD
MRRPLDGSPRVTTNFLQKGYGKLGAHLGIDYAAAVGTPVYAPVGGTIRERVETSGPGSGGKRLELAGDDGRWHRFLHLSRWETSVGQRVQEGQLIAYSGATGDVTGPHLHWDVRRAGSRWDESLSNYSDPEALLSNPTGAIKMNGGPQQHWNVRTSPEIANNIRPEGYAVGGQRYSAQILGNGWAKISFMGRDGFVSPKTFTVI